MIWGQCRNVETAICLSSFICQLHIFYIGWRLHIHWQGCCPETSWTQQDTEKRRKYCQCLCRARRHRAHTKQLWMLHCQDPQGGKQAEFTPARQECCQKAFRTYRPFSCKTCLITEQGCTSDTCLSLDRIHPKSLLSEQPDYSGDVDSWAS